MASQERTDNFLVKKGLARSRQQAQELISLGLVYYQKVVITKPSFLLPSETEDVEVQNHPLREYVSRAALKIKGAVEQLDIPIANKIILDIGISTGGFSDYLLKMGARNIVGVDVGSHQLAESLKKESRLKVIENFNARNLSASDLLANGCDTNFDLIVIDVSFISLEHILPRCVELLGQEGAILALVKPQFEVGIEGLGKGGIVRDSQQYGVVEEKLRVICKNLYLTIQDYFESSIKGADGNKEFFLYAKPNPKHL